MSDKTDEFAYSEDLGVICVYPDDFVYPENAIIDIGGCIIDDSHQNTNPSSSITSSLYRPTVSSFATSMANTTSEFIMDNTVWPQSVASAKEFLLNNGVSSQAYELFSQSFRNEVAILQETAHLNQINISLEQLDLQNLNSSEYIYQRSILTNEKNLSLNLLESYTQAKLDFDNQISDAARFELASTRAKYFDYLGKGIGYLGNAIDVYDMGKAIYSNNGAEVINTGAKILTGILVAASITPVFMFLGMGVLAATLTGAIGGATAGEYVYKLNIGKELGADQYKATDLWKSTFGIDAYSIEYLDSQLEQNNFVPNEYVNPQYQFDFELPEGLILPEDNLDIDLNFNPDDSFESNIYNGNWWFDTNDYPNSANLNTTDKQATDEDYCAICDGPCEYGEPQSLEELEYADISNNDDSFPELAWDNSLYTTDIEDILLYPYFPEDNWTTFDYLSDFFSPDELDAWNFELSGRLNDFADIDDSDFMTADSIDKWNNLLDNIPDTVVVNTDDLGNIIGLVSANPAVFYSNIGEFMQQKSIYDDLANIMADASTKIASNSATEEFIDSYSYWENADIVNDLSQDNMPLDEHNTNMTEYNNFLQTEFTANLDDFYQHTAVI